MNRNEISAYTAFDSGERFESDAQVREYFTVANIRAMFGADADADQDTLDTMAAAVIENRWHMAPMTTPEAARWLDIDPSTVRQAILDGRMDATKRGRDWWIMPEEVARYGRERKAAPSRA